MNVAEDEAAAMRATQEIHVSIGRPKASTRIPVNVIAGTLGVGKTTAINHLLEQRPTHERWAVLVNEYGQIGLDAALMEGSARHGGVEVREVAGGCICCTAGLMFEVSLVLLLQRRPNRLLIEPTGLATLSGILDTLARPGIGEAVDVRSIISLVDPTNLNPKALTVEAQDQIEAADILLANRSDLASPAQREGFEGWASNLFPPKRFVGCIKHGQVPLELLDRVTQRPSPDTQEPSADAHHRHQAHSQATAPDQHTTHTHEPTSQKPPECGPAHPIVRQSHTSPLASTMGWLVWAELIFDADQLRRWTQEIIARPGLRRLKAVFHTDEGWCSLNIAGDARESKPSAYRRDSRLELIWAGPTRPDPKEIEESILSCLVRTSG